MEDSNSNIADKLSPIERKIIPYLKEPIEKIVEKSGLDLTTVLRALKFLENKELVKISTSSKTILDIGINGIYYKKNHFPERKLLLLLETRNHLPLEEAKKLSKLSDNEFKVSLGVLKSKALISLNNGKLALNATKEELTKKSLEEQLLESLPIELSSLAPEQLHALNNLKKRKDIIEIKEKSIISFALTEKGKKIAGTEIKSDLIETLTPEVIKTWTKNKKFRHYDITSQVPQIYGGKRHFVNQAINYGKRIWLDLGFKEMQGSKTQVSFWNFDALFTAQDHPIRELQDTFYIKDLEGVLPQKSLVSKVKQAHETGLGGSKGWQYVWSEEEAKRTVLRTHTTPLSAQSLSKLDLKNLPQKLFAIGKAFRNETVDWSHGFEFNQSEGIVVSRGSNFRHLLGYLKEFFGKMGFKEIKFVPAYFPYTEPSVEILAFHPEKKVWLELGGAGIFRPEVSISLLGEYIPILAWGPGFDRTLMDYYKIKDLRELYKNDLKELRNKEFWLK